MDKRKYEFIQTLLNNKKLNSSQKDRVLNLMQKEIAEDFSKFNELEDRLESLENIITINEKKSDNIFLEVANNNSIIIEDEKGIILSQKSISHNPEQTYQILRSFKFNDGEYAFKYLVHGYNIDSLDDFSSNIKKARDDFDSLKNVPKGLYFILRALVFAYEKYGIDIVKNENVHPFDSRFEIKIHEKDLNILSPLFGNFSKGVFKKDYFKTFQTAIQNFKKKYRFETSDSEASILLEFLNNIIKYESFNDNNLILSFKNKEGLFNENQLTFDLKVETFYAFNFSIKDVFKWIISSVLKHSNIHNNRDFDPIDKKIKISTKKEYDDAQDKYFIYLDIFDEDTLINKDAITFFKELTDNMQEKLKSICDMDVFFTTVENKNYSCSILPAKEPILIPLGKEKGLMYRFKFITN